MHEHPGSEASATCTAQLLQGDACGRPAAVLFVLQTHPTALARCAAHAEALRAALRSYLRDGSWREHDLARVEP